MVQAVPMIHPMAALAAFAISFAMTPLIRWYGRRAGLVDVPNERSSHHAPTPRGGGIAILAGTLATAAALGVLEERGALVIAGGAIVVAIAGLIDDVRSLGALPRLLTHCAAAILLMLFGGLQLERIDGPWGGGVSLALLAAPVTLVFIVGLTNAYNFMDGINGIASLEAVVAATALGVLFLRSGDRGGAILAIAIAAAAAGFLPWNFPSGSIFMGDVGSGALGLLLAALVLRYAAGGGSFVAAVLPLLPFLLDTGVTLVRRIVRRERFYAAHRSHFYQRLNALGWTHSAVTMLWTGLAAAGAVLAVTYARLSPAERTSAVAGLVLVHAAIGIAITLRELSATRRLR